MVLSCSACMASQIWTIHPRDALVLIGPVCSGRVTSGFLNGLTRLTLLRFVHQRKRCPTSSHAQPLLKKNRVPHPMSPVRSLCSVFTRETWSDIKWVCLLKSVSKGNFVLAWGSSVTCALLPQVNLPYVQRQTRPTSLVSGPGSSVTCSQPIVCLDQRRLRPTSKVSGLSLLTRENYVRRQMRPVCLS